MNLRCLIVDDEPLAIKVLEKYAEELHTLEVVATCKDALQALDVIHKEEIDLLFLDINMPRLSGISMIKSLSKPPMVIFVTAYPEYAVEGFELEAVDYLVKPVAFDRFLKAVNKAINLREMKDFKESTPGSAQESEYLIIKADKKLYKVSWNDIHYFQAYGDYVKIFTKEKTLLAKERLINFEATLPSGFMKIHRSYLVNIEEIQYIEGNQVKINEELIPIGQKHKEALMQAIKE